MTRIFLGCDTKLSIALRQINTLEEENKKLKMEIEDLKRDCPRCFERGLKVCTCPIDGPGQGLSCANCGWTHMDGAPINKERSLEAELKGQVRMLEERNKLQELVEDVRCHGTCTDWLEWHSKAAIALGEGGG